MVKALNAWRNRFGPVADRSWGAGIGVLAPQFGRTAMSLLLVVSACFAVGGCGTVGPSIAKKMQTDHWTRNGVDVNSSEVAVYPGCDTSNGVQLLRLGWPVGTRTSDPRHTRWFVRDPAGKVSGSLGLPALQQSAHVPSDALDTGYRRGSVKLYLSPTGQFAYLADSATAERWPYAASPPLCG